jgi:predicted dehydrogenase
MRTVTWGAIGCGDVCERKSGPPLYRVPGCALRGVHRRDAAKGRDFAHRHGCAFFATVDELLADPAIDAVYIATRPDSHREYTLRAAAAGKPVLVEKEMALDADECSAMIAACRRARVSLGVAFYRRCYPSVLRTRELLAADAIGPPLTLRINDQFPLSHRLDLVHFLCGPLAEVRLRTGTLAPGSHAATGVRLHAVSRRGVACELNVGWHESTLVETLVIEGRRGSLAIEDLKAGRVAVVRDGGTRREDVPGLPFTHWGLVDNFSRHLRGAADLACPGPEGRRAQVIEDLVKTLIPDGPAATVDYRD